MKALMLIAAGFVLTALGIIGICIPILPTTPFMLGAAACFASSSPKLYRKLTQTAYVGEFIENYAQKTGVAIKTKVKALIWLWATLIISGLMFRHSIALTILLVVGISVTIHIVLIKTKE